MADHPGSHNKTPAQKVRTQIRQVAKKLGLPPPDNAMKKRQMGRRVTSKSMR